MSENQSHTLSTAGDAPGALSKPPPVRPSASTRPSYGSGKEAEPPVAAEPATSPSYDGAGDGQGYLVHEVESADQDQVASDPPFQPFFTIIEDAHSSVIHHPTVHYIFSDDDTDIIKEAGYRSLEIQGITIPPARKDEDDPESPTDHDSNGEDKSTSILPPAVPGVRTHYLLLDIEPIPATEQMTSDPKSISTSPMGPEALASPISPSPMNQPVAPHRTTSAAPQPQYRVVSAKSFSPTWQILSAELVPAPRFDSGDPDEGPSHGMMLNIRGTGGAPKDPPSKEDGLESLMGRFEKHMSELQAVIDRAKVEEGKMDNSQAGEHDGEDVAEPEVGVEGVGADTSSP